MYICATNRHLVRQNPALSVSRVGYIKSRSGFFEK
jgi:hypothetical protein